jgi:hypothetical protein
MVRDDVGDFAVCRRWMWSIEIEVYPPSVGTWMRVVLERGSIGSVSEGGISSGSAMNGDSGAHSGEEWSIRESGSRTLWNRAYVAEEAST